MLPFLIWAVFYCKKVSAVNNNNDNNPTGDYYKNLIITEIMYNPKGNNSHRQWIELYNDSDTDIHLFKKTFKINDDVNLTLNKKGDAYINCHGIEKNITIPAKKYIVITSYKKNAFYSDYTHSNNIDLYYSALDLPAKKSSIRLSEDRCKHLFIKADYNSNLGGNNNGKTLEKNNLNKSGWHESCIDGGTPGIKNSEEKDCTLGDDDNTSNDGIANNSPRKSIYTDKIKINEIYPSPDTKAGETEFIEIKNISHKNIDLKNWSASDSIHKGKPLKKDCILQPNKFYIFKGKFYLNSSNDSAKVFDENGILVDSLSYNKGKSKYSYAFDGSVWRWTSKITPERKNEFDKILSGKISKDKNIYKNIYASFKVSTDKDAQKFTWDFGDGHKSYLKKTRHKYKKTGTYKASLKITGKGEDAFYNFIVKVKKYKAPKIRITSLSPNPSGRDSNNEWIKIKNKSHHKVNLKNWSIATGWNKLYNHPIRKDLKIKAGKTKKLKRSICAFALANSKTKIEFRLPDGKVVQKIKYNHGEKTIAENELYQKIKSTWKWILPPIKTNFVFSKNTLVKGMATQKTASSKILSTSQPIIITKNPPVIPIINPSQRKKIFQHWKIISFSSSIQTPIIIPKTPFLAYSPQTNLYLFTANHHSQHWLIKLTTRLWIKINSFFNHLWLKF